MKKIHKQTTPRFGMDRVGRFIRDLADAAEEVGAEKWLPTFYRLEKIATHKRCEITMMSRPLADENFHITLDTGAEQCVLSISSSNATNVLYSSYISVAFDDEFLAIDRSTDESELTDDFLDRMEGHIEHLDAGCPEFPEDDYLYVSNKFIHTYSHPVMQSLAKITKGLVKHKKGLSVGSPMLHAVEAIIISGGEMILPSHYFEDKKYPDSEKSALAKLACLSTDGWAFDREEGDDLMEILRPALSKIQLTPVDVKSADILKHSNLVKSPAVMDAFLGGSKGVRAEQFLQLASQMGFVPPEELMAKLNRCLIPEMSDIKVSTSPRKIKI